MIAGDEVIGIYFNRTLTDLDKFVYPDIPAALRMLQETRNVIRVSETGLKGFLKENPFHTQHIHVFGREKPVHQAFIFTKKSPLTSIFKNGILRLKESGTLDQLRNIWEGGYKKGSSTSEAMVLGPGQIIVALGLVIFALLTSLYTIFILETNWKKFSG